MSYQLKQNTRLFYLYKIERPRWKLMSSKMERKYAGTRRFSFVIYRRKFCSTIFPLYYRSFFLLLFFAHFLFLFIIWCGYTILFCCYFLCLRTNQSHSFVPRIFLFYPLRKVTFNWLQLLTLPKKTIILLFSSNKIFFAFVYELG